MVRIEMINEKAELDWLDKKELRFRLRYSSTFYGSCVINGSLMKRGTGLVMDRKSIVMESFNVKKGTPALLNSLATTFLRKILVRDGSVDGLDRQVWRRQFRETDTATAGEGKSATPKNPKKVLKALPETS